MAVIDPQEAAVRRKARAAREAYQKAEDARWRTATEVRKRWTPEDWAEEESRLEAEIAERLASDRVTRFPPGTAAGATGRDLFTGL